MFCFNNRTSCIGNYPFQLNHVFAPMQSWLASVSRIKDIEQSWNTKKEADVNCYLTLKRISTFGDPCKSSTRILQTMLSVVENLGKIDGWLCSMTCMLNHHSHSLLSRLITNATSARLSTIYYYYYYIVLLQKYQRAPIVNAHMQ